VNAVLPLLLSEANVFIFKFWFNGEFRDGMSYHDELFCCLRTFAAQERSQVYHLGCKLTQHYPVIALTTSDDRCGLWVSLRDPHLETILRQAPTLELPKMPNPP